MLQFKLVYNTEEKKHWTWGRNLSTGVNYVIVKCDVGRSSGNKNWKIEMGQCMASLQNSFVTWFVRLVPLKNSLVSYNWRLRIFYYHYRSDKSDLKMKILRLKLEETMPKVCFPQFYPLPIRIWVQNISHGKNSNTWWWSLTVY